MTTQNETGVRTFQATAVALEAFVRVVVDASGTISVAGATDLGIGITQEAIAASGYGTVKLWGAPGTFMCQAAGPVTRGAQLYTAAAGEVDDSGTYKLPFVALEAATAQGDVIECALADNNTTVAGTYVSGDVGTVVAGGTAQANATAITKLVTYVSAADDTAAVVLPTAVAGAVHEIYPVTASKNLVVFPAANDDINDGTANASITLAARKPARFVAVDATTWAAWFTAAS